MKLKITIGDKYRPAMEIKTQQEADAYFKTCVEHNLQCHKAKGHFPNRERAIEVEKSNIGYFAGYYDNKTRERVERLFNCSHPVFGHAQPTAREALAAGMVAAKSGIKQAAKLFER